jgi:hypothetical protein
MNNILKFKLFLKNEYSIRLTVDESKNRNLKVTEKARNNLQQGKSIVEKIQC